MGSSKYGTADKMHRVGENDAITFYLAYLPTFESNTKL